MGRFGIGSRVRTATGDAATIVGKKPGMRLVETDDGTRRWWPKEFLELDYDSGSFSFNFDTGELKIATAAPAEKEEFAFKVGDRVVFTTKTPAFGAEYYDGVLTVESVWKDGNVKIAYPSFGEWVFPRLTQVTDASSLKHFALRAGDIYRSRAGGKCSPMVAIHPEEAWSDSKGIAAGLEDQDGYQYSVDGYWLSGGRDCPMDIVGPWVEPAPKPKQKFKVGDVVNWTVNRAHWQGIEIVGIFHNGNYVYAHAKDEYSGTGAFPTDQLELVSASPATFPVGKKVLVSGRVTGSNGDNISVAVSGPRGTKSYDFPATTLRTA